MSWQKVGDWLKDNADTGVALVGSLLTGNVKGAVAAGAALVGSATGTTDPMKALQALQTSPETLLKLQQLAQQEAQSIRENLAKMEELRLNDGQQEHAQTQETIRQGDSSDDEYTRRTRPMIARHGWYAGLAYLFIFEGAKALGYTKSGADFDLLMLVFTMPWTYMGARMINKAGMVERFFGKR